MNNSKIENIQALARIASLFFGFSHFVAIGMFWYIWTLDYKILMVEITTALIIVPVFPRRQMIKYPILKRFGVIFTALSIVVVIIMMIIDLFRSFGPDIGGFILRGIVLACLIIMFNEIRLLKDTENNFVC